MRIPLLAIVLSTVIAPRLLHAQETAQTWPGLATSELSTVYVLDDTGTETTGQLVRLNPDSLVVLVDGAERRFDVARVKRVQKRGDSLKNGLIIGAVVGAVLGGISAGIADCPGSGSSCAGFRVAGFAISTAVYTAIGAGIDALVQGRTTLYTAAPSRTAGSAARGPSGGPAFSVSFRLPIRARR